MRAGVVFLVSNSSVTEGDVVEVQWDAPGAQNMQLVIDNGYKHTALPLGEQKGCKRFRLHRSKGRTTVSLNALLAGRKICEKRYIRVKPIPSAHAESVDDQGRRIGTLRSWWIDAKRRIGDMWRRYRLAYKDLDPRRKLAFDVLMLCAAGLVLCLVMPRFIMVLPFAVMAFCVWQLYKGNGQAKR